MNQLFPLFLVLIVSGCLQAGQPTESPIDRPTLFEVETAEYHVTVNGEPAGSVMVSMEAESENLLVHAEAVREVDDVRKQIKADAHVNRTTGSVEVIQTPGEWFFTHGVRGVVPDSASFFALGSLDAGRRGIFPVGPQWAVLSGDPESWGGAKVVHLTHNSVALEFACEYMCPDEPGTDAPWSVHMTGIGPGLLPEQISETIGTFQVTWTRAEHDISGQEFPVSASEPAVPVIAADARCLPVPCESDAWPSRWSVEDGFASLEADPRWAAFRQQHGQARPVNFFRDHTTSTGPENDLWFLTFGDPADGRNYGFGLTRTIRPGPAVLGPGAPSDGGSNPRLELGAAPVPGMVAADDLLATAAALVGRDPSSLEQIQILYNDAVHYPDGRYGAWWYATFGSEPGDPVAILSATTGEPHKIKSLASLDL